MTILDIIDKKRLKQELTFEEIKYVVDNFVNGNIPDYQMSALLMAMVINGMTEKETIDLTKVMIDSGDIIDLSSISGIKVDKHSTGGVGDKTTLILAPLVASCGVKVVKMSGRGLGHTGGTIDKLEAIKGFKVNLSVNEFIKQVNDIGVAITSQTGNLVPADKKIYALRDVTGTVSSIPLIATSIMSKKIASGADKIVIDVKVGNGALIKTIEEARILANLMIKIGKQYGKDVVCVLSDMNQPLGQTIGNGLEVVEAIHVLRVKGSIKLRELVITLGSIMVSLGKQIALEEAKKEIMTNLINGQAYQKFMEMVKAQNGDIDKINISFKSYSVKSKQEGYINGIDALGIGEIVRKLGGGRFYKEDEINYGVGILLEKSVGEYVKQGDKLLTVYYDEKRIDEQEILNCFMIEKERKEEKPLIYEIIE